MSSFFRPHRAGLVVLLVAFALTRAGISHAEDSKKAQCAAAYEKSQELRAAGSLKAANESLVVCAQEFCPAFVQTDCAQWLTEVQRELPTIVFVAKDKAGEDTSAVAVSMDGAELMKQLDGKAVIIDPGPHAFRFEFEGAEPVEQQVVIRQGQKDRVIAVSFAPPGADTPGESPYAGAKGQAAADAGQSNGPGPLRMYAYIAGGVGAAGIIGFAVLGAIGKAEENDLRDSGCSPNCSRSDTDAIKTKYIVADVLLGVGIAGLGTGVALFFLSQPKKEEPKDTARGLKFDVRAAPGAAFATVDGRF